MAMLKKLALVLVVFLFSLCFFVSFCTPAHAFEPREDYDSADSVALAALLNAWHFQSYDPSQLTDGSFASQVMQDVYSQAGDADASVFDDWLEEIKDGQVDLEYFSHYGNGLALKAWDVYTLWLSRSVSVPSGNILFGDEAIGVAGHSYFSSVSVGASMPYNYMFVKKAGNSSTYSSGTQVRIHSFELSDSSASPSYFSRSSFFSRLRSHFLFPFVSSVFPDITQSEYDDGIIAWAWYPDIQDWALSFITASHDVYPFPMRILNMFPDAHPIVSCFSGNASDGNFANYFRTHALAMKASLIPYCDNDSYITVAAVLEGISVAVPGAFFDIDIPFSGCDISSGAVVFDLYDSSTGNILYEWHSSTSDWGYHSVNDVQPSIDYVVNQQPDTAYIKYPDAFLSGRVTVLNDEPDYNDDGTAIYWGFYDPLPQSYFERYFSEPNIFGTIFVLLDDDYQLRTTSQVIDGAYPDGSTVDQLQPGIPPPWADRPPLFKKFPFCIPFDFSDLLWSMQSARDAPRFQWVFPTGTGTSLQWFDLAPFDPVAEAWRKLFFILFSIGLLFLFARVIGVDIGSTKE
jgi:hypothetical protein